MIDILSRIKRFWIQAEHFLYQEELIWRGTASVLLCRVEKLGYDKHLFLLKVHIMNLSTTSRFYQSVLITWSSAFNLDKDIKEMSGAEPLGFNPRTEPQALESPVIHSILVNAGITRICSLRAGGSWRTDGDLRTITGIKSSGFLNRLLEKILTALKEENQRSSGSRRRGGDAEHHFPSVRISPKIEEHGEEKRKLLMFTTAQDKH